MYNTAIQRSSLVIPRDVVAGDNIDDDIDPFSTGEFFRFFDEILRTVIDGEICTQRQTGLPLLFRAYVTSTVAPNTFDSIVAVVPMPEEPP